MSNCIYGKSTCQQAMVNYLTDYKKSYLSESIERKEICSIPNLMDFYSLLNMPT